MGTESIMLPLGTKAPNFSLHDVLSNEAISLNSYKNQPLLIVFLCNHCPYVLHVRNAFTSIAHEYLSKGVQVIAINANSTKTHPQDGPEQMKIMAEQLQWKFPFLFDESQAVAKNYKAACTPDFYVFNENHKLFYRGRMDGARPKNNEVNDGKDLKNALDRVLEGKNPPEKQYASMGCSIKWHPGKEPDYWG